MFLIRFALPLIVILALILVFTAPWWSKWVARFFSAAKNALDQAGENLKNIGK